jgi:hypothetical protein
VLVLLLLLVQQQSAIALTHVFQAHATVIIKRFPHCQFVSVQASRER